MRIRLPLVVLGMLVASAGAAQEHESRFEFTEAFVKDWGHHPVRDLQAMLDCAGPVHPAEQDCELHIGAHLVDPSIGDFAGIVLEPPSICADGGVTWRTTINAFKNESCVGRGFLRAWPEHLASGSGCSNPNHILEVHPLLTLTCGNHEPLSFADKLRVVDNLGYKNPSTVNKMLSLRLWVCRTCAPSGGDLAPLAFDYCFGKQCTREQASNFARFKTRIITSTIRPKTGETLEGFASVIARVLPIDANGNATGSRMQLLKLYALEGSTFYTSLLALRSVAAPDDLDLIGIFTIDPFSILKTLEQPSEDDWILVPYPVALVVFGAVEQ
jgi:hypothetical protein